MVCSACSVLFCVLPCMFCSCVFGPFSIVITLLGEERAGLDAFRTFVRFAPVWFCLFPLPLGVWEGLRFLIVALPGLSSYFFFHVFWLRIAIELFVLFHHTVLYCMCNICWTCCFVIICSSCLLL